MESFSTVNPVFIKSRDIPGSEAKHPSVLEICLAAENISGQGSVLGAQNIRGLWRIYPTTKEGRSELLIKGLRMRGVLIQVSHTNPFVLRNETGEEKPTTKLWIDNLPISLADSEIEHSLSKIGCELRSTIRIERVRDQDNKLTRFVSGRRFVYISVPPSPLDKFLKVSFFTAKLFHKEQKENKKPVKCSRCLETGHHVSQCSGDVICRQCGQPAHKRGDALCQIADEHTADKQTEGQNKNTKNTAVHSSESGSPKGGQRSLSVSRNDRDRGRTTSRQTTILASLERSPRDRSPTPKRRRSLQRHSPRHQRGKQPRRDDGGSDSLATTDTNGPDTS